MKNTSDKFKPWERQKIVLAVVFFGYLAPSIKIQLIPYTIILTLREIPIILKTKTKAKPSESAVCYRPTSDQ